MTDKRCRAKDPATCSHHGNLSQGEKALREIEKQFQKIKEQTPKVKNLQILQELNKPIDEEFVKPTFHEEKRSYIDRYYIVRHTNSYVRYIWGEYNKAYYSKSPELDVAKKKLSTVYQMSANAGYIHGEDDIETYNNPKEFYPVFREAIEMLKNPNITDEDVRVFRAKVRLCDYGFNHIKYINGECGDSCKNDVGRYITYDLPRPVF